MWAAPVPLPTNSYGSLNMSSKQEIQILADIAKQKTRDKRRDSLEAIDTQSSSVTTTTSADLERSNSNRLTKGVKPHHSPTNTATSESIGESSSSSILTTIRQKLSRSNSLPSSVAGSDDEDCGSEISAQTEPRKDRKRDRLRRKLSHVMSPAFYLDSIAVTYPVAEGFVPVIF